MKNLRNSLFALLLMSSALVVFGQKAPLGSGEGEVVLCKCTGIGKCKASGSGNLCAQSEPGGNINCQDYNGNC